MLNDWIKLLDDTAERPKETRPVLPGEVVRYGRRSVKGEGGLAGIKSVTDQDAETADICDEYGLPTRPEDYFAEPPGYSGKAPYDGGTGRHAIHEEHKYDEKGRRRVRPRLTDLVREVMAGRKRVVVVWSLCRLWRSVRLCEHLLDLFEEHAVELYDKDGRVDYTSPKGRSDVVGAAVRYETQRKEAKQGVERGLRRNRKKGKIASNPNCLGMRTKGTRLNAVRFLDDELFWVERMMRLFVGDGESGPIPTREIAKKVVAEGFRWPDDLRRTYERCAPRPGDLVTSDSVQKVLKNPRYVGYHPTKSGAYACEAFLRNGKPLVPLELFLRVQKRLQQERRVGGSKNEFRAFSSLVLCGFDAMGLQCQTAHAKLAGGVIDLYGIWRSVPRERGWCNHRLPNVRDDILMEYVTNTLGPLLESEIESRSSQAVDEGRMSELRDQILRIENDLRTAEELSSSTWREDPMYGFRIQQRLRSERKAVQEHLARLETEASEALSLKPYVVALATEDAALRADAVRALVRWVAVVPSGKPKIRWQDTGEPARNPDQGRLLFCLAFGGFHTAVIEFGGAHPQGYRKRINLLRAAEPHECLGGVEDLPAPETFLKHLQESRIRRGADFDLAVDAPGYVPRGGGAWAEEVE